MNNRKIIMLVISIIFLGLIITAGSYAFWSWVSSPNKSVAFNTSKALRNYIVYNEGESKFSGELKVGSNYQDNSIHTTIALSKTQDAANVSLVATIHLDVNAIGENMKKSNALKWAVTKGNSTTPGQLLAQGNFVGTKNGDTLTLVPNIEVTTTNTEYTVWIWLDRNANPSDSLTGETLDTNVWTEINQIEGTDDRFEITRTGVNYQNISATVVDSKAKVTQYAVVPKGETPTTWRNIDTPSNIYNLDYAVDAAGEYDIYFKDELGRTAPHKTVNVTAVDNTAPSCTFGNWNVAQIANNETANIDLTCTDNESEITVNNLKVSDITASNTNITITNIKKTAVTNGYKYTITVKGTENDGTTKLTLPAAKVKNAMALGNASVESSTITVANTYTVKYQSGNNNCELNTTTYANKTATYGTAYNVVNPTCTGYTFDGWTANSGLDTTNAKYGNSASTVTTTWSNANTKVKATWFNNLALSTTKTVTLTANWTANALTFADKTITKTFSTSAQTETNGVNEASNGSGNYTYAITGGNSNSYFSLSGRNLTIKASTPANTTGYSITITATDTTTGATKAATYKIVINKATCVAPTNVTIGTDKKVSWTASATASSYEISMSASSDFAAHTSGSVYNAITDATGSRTVYVRSVCNSTNYNTPSTNASKATTVYSVALTKGTGISSVSGAGNYITGATVAIDATVSEGHTWSKWTQTSGGTQVSATKSYSAVITSNWAYTANATANNYTITVKAGNGISALTLADWTGTGTTSLTKDLAYGTELDLTTFTETFKTGYSGNTYTKNSGAGTLNASTSKFTVGLGNAELTIAASTLAVPTCVVTGGGEIIYGNNSTITANNTVEYASGVTLHYQFGYSTSTSGTLSNFSTNSTSSTYDVAGDYFGIRYYGAKIYATDGTLTSSTCTTGTGTANRASVRFINAKITFDPNGGTLNNASYSPRYTRSGQTGTTSMYTSSCCTSTAGYSPTASKTGYTFNGWWTAPTGGYQVLTSSRAFTGTAVAGYTTTNAWAVLEDKTLYAQFKDSTVPTLTLTGGTPAKTYAKSSEATITIADNVALAEGTYNFKYKWSTTSVSCTNMTDYETTSITVAEGDTTKSKTLNITNKTGSGTLYVCNIDPILDADSNKVAANTLESVRMYLDSSGPTARLTLTINSGVRATLTYINDSPGIGVQTPYYYKIDNINNNPTCNDQTEGFISSTATSYTFTTITEVGTYNVCVRLVDKLGNMTHLSDNVEIRTELKNLSGTSSYFKSTTYRDKIVDIKFADSINIPDNSLVTYNLDATNIGLIKGWIVNNTINASMHDLYIGANSTIFASGSNLSNAFANMQEVETISLGNLNTSNATSMYKMFNDTGRNATNFSLDLGNNFNTSNVTDMSQMFYEIGQNATNFSLDLGNNFDTSNVTNMAYMFSNMGRNATNFSLDLGDKFDTSNVTIMAQMFESTGQQATNFSLDLGDKFNTSNVKNMANMFSLTGYNATNFSFDLGDRFDTSNVKNMAYMFAITGRNATNFSLDLGNNFNTSNVTDMSKMFYEIGQNATNFSLDLGDKFNTSNVTAMAYMFSNMGRNATNFSLNLGDNFDTSNVTDMSSMFFGSGYNATNFSLDLGDKFDTSNVTDMSQMFFGSGYNATNFSLNLGNKFNTINVTNMTQMFTSTGRNATNFNLDLGNNFDTSNVTSMYGMFSYMGRNATNFSLDLGDKFDTSNVTDMSRMFYEIGQNATNFNLNLGNNFDTSNVTSMYAMFSGTGFNATNFSLNLGNKFNTINVTNMTQMFTSTGRNATNFNLDLGNNFDTSNVTNMAYMFDNMGYNAANFSFDLGNNFNASNVISMRSMFSYMGYNATNFSLDLGNDFNAINVTNITNMFDYMGYKAIDFSLDLGNNFNLSNVTRMDWMFSYMGRYATNFSLDLGNNFNPSNVISMISMFSNLGNYATNFSLDLGNNFNTSNVTNMRDMFFQTGSRATNFNLDLGNKFDTSNVRNMYSMFYLTGRFTQTNFELDLSAGNFGKLTTSASYRDMFHGFPSNYATIYVKDTDAQNWIISKNSSWGTNFSAANVLVKGAS